MRFSLATHGKFKILKIEEPFLVLEELNDLKEIIDGLIAKGELNFCVNFSEISYLYSGAINALIKIYKNLKEKDGTIGILEPKKEVRAILHDLGLHKLIPIYSSEEDLDI